MLVWLYYIAITYIYIIYAFIFMIAFMEHHDYKNQSHK